MGIPIRVAGIPAIARITHLHVQKPNLRADNDMDYLGYEELCYDICDSRGRPAPWLEAKNDKTVEEQIWTYLENME